MLVIIELHNVFFMFSVIFELYDCVRTDWFLVLNILSLDAMNTCSFTINAFYSIFAYEKIHRVIIQKTQ